MSISVFSKLFSALMPIILATTLVFSGVCAWAFSASQESQWQSDIKEAKARAKDFQKHIERLRRADVERESASQEIKLERAKDEQRLEKSRREYIVWRNKRPSPEKEEMRLEQEHLKMLEAEARKEEALREAYVVSRDRVRGVLEKEAFIDEALEYNVHSAPTIEEQNKIPHPHLLKFDVKKGSENK
jgi:septal ring factor EnvC (AmiA/AmiB activator)